MLVVQFAPRMTGISGVFALFTVMFILARTEQVMENSASISGFGGEFLKLIALYWRSSFLLKLNVNW